MRTLFALLLLATPTMADHCRIRSNAVVIQSSGAIITPFAVPVAVPTSVVVPGYTYSHAGASAAAVDPEYQEFLAWKAAKANQVKAAVVPQSLLQQNCVGCHTTKADAKDHFDMSGELTADQKLKAIAAVMTGKMPKAKILDPQVRADIVAELSGASK